MRPVLSVGYVGSLMANGELRDVEARLQDAERWIDTTANARGGSKSSSTAMVVADEDEFRRLPSAIAMYRAAQAQILGDVPGTLAHARRAMELAGEADHLGRGAAAGFLALTYWGSGELEAAYRSWADAMASLSKAGHVVDAVACARALAEIRIAQGRLREAMSTYERGLQLATEHSAPGLRGVADMHVGMSELYLEWNDLDAAIQHLLKSDELGPHAALARNPYRSRVAMARIREAEGDADGALDLLRDAERLYVSEYFPEVRPIAAMRARICVFQGRLDEAQGWVRERGLSVDDELSYLREFEHITFARVLVAQSAQDQNPVRGAMALVDRLLEAAEGGKRERSVIEILVLQALAHQRLGNIVGALVPLERALTLAEPEGQARLFVDEGASMAALLTAAAKHGIAPEYARRLLEGFGHPDVRTHAGQPLVEPLSERELEVLRLLGTDLDGPGIAGELVIGLSTVRSHTKSIYAKLSVNNRRAAVRRGDELGLRRRDKR